jgi:hypothetical protein
MELIRDHDQQILAGNPAIQGGMHLRKTIRCRLLRGTPGIVNRTAAGGYQGGGHALQQLFAVSLSEIKRAEISPLGDNRRHNKTKTGQQSVYQDGKTEKRPPGNQVRGGQVVNTLFEDNTTSFYLRQGGKGRIALHRPCPRQGDFLHQGMYRRGAQLDG